MRQVILRAIGVIVFAPWTYFAYKIFIKCPWLGGAPTIDLDAFWKATHSWTYLTLAVVLYVIFLADTSPLRSNGWQTEDLAHVNTSNRRVILLGLIGGFAIALPALAITLLAFVTTFPHFIEALKAGEADPRRPAHLIGGQKIELKSTDSAVGSAYVLGVDVSRSVIKDEHGEEELAQINDLVSLLFSRDPDRVLDSLIGTSDVYWSYAFAGDQFPLAQRGQAFQNIRAAVFPQAFKKALDERLKNGEDRSETDILGFLEAMVANLKISEAKHSHVTVLVFSDFRQDSGNRSYAGIKAQTHELMNDLRELNNVHLVGVYMDAAEGQSSGIDIRRYLDYYSGEGLWREISLGSFSAANLERKKSMLVFGIYQEVREREPLYLKYQVAPWRPILANIEFSKDQSYDGILVGLRPSRGSDGSTPQIQIVLGEKEPTVLTIGGTESDFEILPRMSSAENPLPTSLKSKLDVSRSLECELLVAVPSRALVHAVPIIILPVVGDLPLQIFRLSLQFIGWILFFLAIGALGLDELLRLLCRNLNQSVRERLRPSAHPKPTENTAQEG